MITVKVISRLLWSYLIGPICYTLLYNIWLMLSVCICPKVITLSRFHFFYLSFKLCLLASSASSYLTCCLLRMANLLTSGLSVLSILSFLVSFCPPEVSGCHYTMVIIQNGTRINTTGWARNAIFSDQLIIIYFLYF